MALSATHRFFSSHSCWWFCGRAIFSVLTQPVPSNIVELIREEAGTLVRGQTFSKYCKTCLHPKAARMHHCHVCKKCVSRMDHHCPWIGGCVGFANYR